MAHATNRQVRESPRASAHPQEPLGGRGGLAPPRRWLPTIVLLGAPGALTAYVAFRAGGFFPGTQGLLVAGLAVALALRLTLASRPLAGASRTLVVAAGAMTLYAAWTLASVWWSGSPARATLDFDRALLYLLTLVLFGLVPMTPDRLRWMVRGLALAALVICAYAFMSRALPELLPTTPAFATPRLANPVTYWNTLGLVGALGAILSLHLTCSEHEPGAVRAVATAALPILACTVYLTLSRGAVVAGSFGLIAYVLLGRERLLLTGLSASIPASVVALRMTYEAQELLASDPVAPAAVAQGQRVALAVALCVTVGAAARSLLLPVDGLITQRPPRKLPLPGAAGVMTLGAIALAVTFVSVGAPRFLGRQYDAFVSRHAVRDTGDIRDRLTDPASSYRVALWRVGVRAFQAEPLHGHGAGTYQLLWNRRRPFAAQAFDAHSLYVETLAELGWPGLAALGIALLTLLGGMAVRIRGPDRALFAAIFAASATWALRAGGDWDWEMPVVTLWLFALGGATLATPLRTRAGAAEAGPDLSPTLRVAAALGCLVLAVTPVRAALSQAELNRAVAAFERGDCRRTIDESLGSIEALSYRPEPFQLLAYCDVRLGAPPLAVRAMSKAVRLDPDNWEYRYGLALVRAAAGMDPRPAARQAQRLNPEEELTREGVERFAAARPQEWRRLALEAPLPR